MICFVVLHYQNLDVTQKCVNFLLKLNGENKHIIIVDNGSPNVAIRESGFQIFRRKKYLEKRVICLLAGSIFRDYQKFSENKWNLLLL